jgi:hypothetical protein
MDRGVINNNKNYYYQPQQRYHHHAASASAYAPVPPHMLFAYPPGPASSHGRPAGAAYQHYQPYSTTEPVSNTPWDRLERANIVGTGNRIAGSDGMNNIKKFCFRCALRGHVTRECRQFKTKPCKYFESPAGCKFTGAETSMCFFAHGPTDLRSRDDVYCVRIVYDDGIQTVMGCGAAGHSFDACPASKTTAAATPEAAPTGADEENNNDDDNTLLATQTIESILE